MATGVITTGAHPKALWLGIRDWTHQSYAKHPLEVTEIFGAFKDSDQHHEETVEATGFPIAPVKPEGGGTTYVGQNQGPTTTYLHVAYGMGYIVTYEEMRDNKYKKLATGRSEALRFSFVQTKETVGANVLNRGFLSGYPGADGKELFATDHPIAGGGTQSNELPVAADFSEAALEDMMILIGTARNNMGHPIRIMGRKLIVPPQLMFEAERILNSTLRPGTANNDTNAMNAMGMLPDGVAVNHYLSDADAWFVKTDAPHGLTAFMREGFSFDRDNDFDTKNARAAGYERYSFGWSDWRGAYGTPGAA